jgi:hypothetical protein
MTAAVNGNINKRTNKKANNSHTDWNCKIDTTQYTKVEYRRSKSSLMHKPEAFVNLNN